MKSIAIKLFLTVLFYPIFSLLIFTVFKPIFNSDSLIFPYAIHPFDIIKTYPYTWMLIKKWYFISFSISYAILSFHIFSLIGLIFLHHQSKPKSPHFHKHPVNNSSLKLFIGLNQNKKIYLDEFGLYQNVLVTGTIGSGKTSSIMYPITRQLIGYKSSLEDEKISMLILDVKGNYYKQVLSFANETERLNDVVVIDLSGNTTYNPLDKPSLSPIVLANRLKTILTLFSPNNQESYWLDKSEQFLAECIKFCRLYNDGYVTFSEIHKLVLLKDYYQEKLNLTKKFFLENKYNKNQVYDLLTCIDFFEKEIFSLDERTLSILRSEISRITNIFVSDYNVSRTFCPQKKDITFPGFEFAIKTGKIVVLNLNIAEYRNLSKIIASYLKLDFQTEVLSQTKSSSFIRKTAFISDEYHEYVTQTDSDFFAESREAKCINIVATQSYSSIRKALHDDLSSNVIIQGLVNKLWFRTDDNYTIEEIQKQLGKEEKEKTSRTISENARETKYNLAINSLLSSGSSISESINVYSQNDYIYDSNFFSQKLQTFNCLAFISDGMRVQKPHEITTIPYYLQKGV